MIECLKRCSPPRRGRRKTVTLSDYGAGSRAIPPLKARGHAMWGKPIAHPTLTLLRCVIRLSHRTTHRAPRRCTLFVRLKSLQNTQTIARLSKRARPVLGSIPSLDVSMRVICTALAPISSHMTHPCGRASVIICERGAVAGQGRVI